jgi:outer membrane lipoprotein LolB
VLSGRIVVRVDGQPQRSVNAGFELSGNAQQGGLSLTGPLGTTAAQAAWATGQAWLVTDRGRRDYANLDELATAALGERIPIAALFSWLRGQPWGGAPHAPRPDGVAGFEQLGWVVDLSRWQDRRVEARRDAPPSVTVRALLEQPG